MKAKRIYLASSWRNEFQPDVVQRLRAEGFDVYDFRNPPHGRGGFQWSRIGADWLQWSPQEYRRHLSHPYAEEGFRSDYEAMLSCDVCVLLLPCGRSAHAEAGWFAGAGRPVHVLCPVQQEPELMYKLFTSICCSVDELIDQLQQAE